MKLLIFWRLTLAACLALPGLAWGNDGTSSELAALYQEVQQGQESSLLGAPIFVRSIGQGDRIAAEVYGIIEHPFAEVADRLTKPANWCQFMPLTFNVKACTYQDQRQGQDNQPLLTFYIGRKFYEPPEKAYPLHYRYQLISREDNYVRMLLSADEGPMGSQDNRIELDAIPVGEKSFVRIRSSYHSTFVSWLGTYAYLVTLGRDKVGFSVVGTTETGEPIYIGGMNGVIERNSVRYYLALKAFFDTNYISPAERFEARIRTWFDLCEAHPTQLHELERDEYLGAKRKERINQFKLQRQLNRIN